VFHCHFGVGVGSEFQKRRPCVVLSNSINNMNNSVVVVAPITHTQKDLPICVPIADKRNADGNVILDGCANLSGLRSVSSYRLAGLICELEKSEMDKIDAAIARHLDVIRHYNTLLAIIQDDKDHIEKLNTVLNKLREVTGAVNNMGLLEAVKKLVAESAENSKK
jgi:mRNA interferase MazF